MQRVSKWPRGRFDSLFYGGAWGGCPPVAGKEAGEEENCGNNLEQSSASGRDIIRTYK